MKHSVTINLTIEGNVSDVLNKIRFLVGDYSQIATDPEVEIVGINFHKEFDHGPVSTGTARIEVEREEPTPENPPPTTEPEEPTPEEILDQAPTDYLYSDPSQLG